MKNTKPSLAGKAALIILAVVLIFTGVRRISMDARYETAVDSLECGDYQSALETFEALGDYRFSRQLKNYTLALIYSESDIASAKSVARSYISLISEGYRGDLCEDIKAFKLENSKH